MEGGFLGQLHSKKRGMGGELQTNANREQKERWRLRGGGGGEERESAGMEECGLGVEEKGMAFTGWGEEKKGSSLEGVCLHVRISVFGAEGSAAAS